MFEEFPGDLEEDVLPAEADAGRAGEARGLEVVASLRKEVAV